MVGVLGCLDLRDGDMDIRNFLGEGDLGEGDVGAEDLGPGDFGLGDIAGDFGGGKEEVDGGIGDRHSRSLISNFFKYPWTRGSWINACSRADGKGDDKAARRTSSVGAPGPTRRARSSDADGIWELLVISFIRKKGM